MKHTFLRCLLSSFSTIVNMQCVVAVLGEKRLKRKGFNSWRRLVDFLIPIWVVGSSWWVGIKNLEHMLIYQMVSCTCTWWGAHLQYTTYTYVSRLWIFEIPLPFSYVSILELLLCYKWWVCAWCFVATIYVNLFHFSNGSVLFTSPFLYGKDFCCDWDLREMLTANE